MEFLHQYNGFDEAILQRQHNYFKQKPGKSVVETRVKLMTLMRSRVQLNSNHEQGNWDSLKAPDAISTQDYLDEFLAKALHPVTTESYLQICFLTMNFGTAQQHFSTWQSAIETFRGCQRDLHLAPARIIARCLEKEWNLKSISKPNVHLTSSQLPSRKTNHDVDLLSDKSDTIYDMRWQSGLLAYTNDVNVYVWQPHLNKIPSEHYNSITIVVPPDVALSIPVVLLSHRMLVVADPPALMPRFLDTQDTFVKSTDTTHVWDAGHERLRIFVVFLMWIVEDSSDLVDQMDSRISEMMYKGRRRPTRSKIQYLVHLDDCRRLAIKNLWHAKTMADKAKSAVKANTFCCNRAGSPDKAKALKVLSGFQDDIIFLISKFEALEKALLLAREQIKEQMELAQGQRALILTIAAALFIPLGFIASIFGMNVKDPLFQKSPKSSAASTTLSASTTMSASSTVLPPTATPGSTEPTQHYWTMSSYLEISLPLTTAVIVLPLIVPPLSRFVLQQYERYRRNRSAFFILWVTLYFASLIAMTCIYDPLLWMIYLCVGYSVLGVIGLVRLVRAYKVKKGRLRWSIFAVVVVSCVMIDEYVYDSPPWALMAYLYIFLTSTMGLQWLRYGWRWLRRRMRSHPATTKSSEMTV